jgi:hypothetical protein
MRVTVLHLALMVVVLSLGCERESGSEPGLELEPEPEPEVAPAARSGTVVADSVFRLAWPNDQATRACIEIPANAVPAGTKVTISLNVDSNDPSRWPEAFRNWRQQDPGRKVYRPLIELSADSAFTITDTTSYFTVGICARYGEQEDDPEIDPGETAQVAHPSEQTLELLERVSSPCQCSSGSSQDRQGASGRASAVLAGTLLVPGPLEASVLTDQGLGGKGGSFSPFGVVRP